MNKQQDKRSDKQHVIWEEHLAHTPHASGIFGRESAAGESEGGRHPIVEPSETHGCAYPGRLS